MCQVAPESEDVCTNGEICERKCPEAVCSYVQGVRRQFILRQVAKRLIGSAKGVLWKELEGKHAMACVV